MRLDLELPADAWLLPAPAKTENPQKTAGADQVFLGIDLGTTSIEWQAWDMEMEKMLASGSGLNPQGPAGADVISRLAYARDAGNRNRLASLVLEYLRKIIGELEQSGHKVKRAGVAANSAMTAILLKVKRAFSVAPGLPLKAAYLKPEDLASLCLAGALGGHADIADLENPGFIPAGLSAITSAVGNTALAGACLLARFPEKLPCLNKHCLGAIDPNLAGSAEFVHKYVENMHWGQE